MTQPSDVGPMAEDHPKQAATGAEDAAMGTEAVAGEGRSAAAVAGLLRGFLAVQQRRAEAYSTLRRYRCCRAPVRSCHSGSQPNPNDLTRNFWLCAETVWILWRCRPDWA